MSNIPSYLAGPQGAQTWALAFIAAADQLAVPSVDPGRLAMESSRSPKRWAVPGAQARTDPPPTRRSNPSGVAGVGDRQPTTRPPGGPARPGSLGVCPARHTRSTSKKNGQRAPRRYTRAGNAASAVHPDPQALGDVALDGACFHDLVGGPAKVSTAPTARRTILTPTLNVAASSASCWTDDPLS